MLLLAASAPCARGETPAAQPNVLFIAVDDLRPELGCYGQSQIHSPNIDRLAAEGTVFLRAYCQQAVCSPSRTSLMTGLRPDAAGVHDLKTHFRDTVPSVVTLPQHFKQHGYHAEWWGKIYHAALLDPDSWSRQGRRYEPEDNWRAYRLPESNRLAAENAGGGPPFECADLPDNAYPDGRVAESAVEALRRLKDDPFFLAVGFYKPHLPFNAPKKYWDLYDPAEICLPVADAPPEGSPAVAQSRWGELRAYSMIPPSGPVDDATALRLIHGYRACVSYTDAQVGKLLDELSRLGLADRTIVVLWGDHGWKLGDYGQWCKHSNFEFDARAPLIVKAPAAEAPGSHTEALVEFVDIYPTLCELARLPLPANLQGESFAPLLDAPEHDGKSVVFSQYPRAGGVMGYSARSADYRYTAWLDSRGAVIGEELYDHRGGLEETANIAESPAGRMVAEGMLGLIGERLGLRVLHEERAASAAPGG